MMMRRKVLWLMGSAFSALFLNQAKAQLGILPYSGASSAVVTAGFSQMKIGAGGLITGLDIAADGTRVCRTDTYGAYLWNASGANPGNAGGLGVWQQICTTNSIPSSLIIAGTGKPLDSPTANGGKGVYEIAIDPNNTSIFWMVFYGYLLRSTNKGATWSQITGFTQDINAESNTGSGARQLGPHIAIDPQNSAIVYVGVTTGLFVTTNGTAAAGSVTFAKVTALANPGNNSSGDSGGVLIAFDPNSSVVSSKKQGIYASSYGTGVYHSTDGGTNWTLTTGTPTTHFNMRCSALGTLFLVDDANSSSVRKFAGTWATVSTGTGANISVDIDPSNSSRIAVIDSDGNISVSTSGGTSFAGTTTHTIVAADIPWHAQNNTTSMFGSAIRFDPSQSNVLVQAWGFGIAQCNPPNTVTNVTWNSQSAGIEQLVVNRIVSPPSGNPVLVCWDRVGFTSVDATKYPSQQNAFYGSTVLSHGWGVDWATATPATLVTYADFNFGNNDESGVSTDKGVTWTKFASISYNGGQGGCCAASTSSLFLVQSGNNTPQYTANGGTSWTVCPGLPANGAYQTGVTTFWPQLMAADRVDANTFYVFTGPIWKSTANPPSFSQVSTGSIDTYGFNIPILASVPNNAGHLFFSLGKGSGQPFRRSTDHGTTWSTVANVTEVWAFDCGKVAPGQSYPAIYIIGFVSNVWGLWRSIDNAVSWTKLVDYPLASFDTPTTVAADANTYGVVYVGFQGSGAARGVF